MSDEKSLIVYVDEAKALVTRPLQAAWGWLTDVQSLQGGTCGKETELYVGR
jgi:hypothetical protein